MLGEGFYGGFGGIVGGVPWRISYALFGARKNDAAGVRGGTVGGYEREERVEAVNHTKKIDIHDLVEITGVWPGTSETDSGVQGEEVDLAYWLISSCSCVY